MKRLRTHYENLQVTENASPEVIRGAYKFLSQKWHPDKNQHQREKAERITKIINDAYTVLSDPERRREHDTWIANQRYARGFQPPEPTVRPNPARRYAYQYSYALMPAPVGRGERFIDLGDGTVMDMKTGLQWFVHSVGESWSGGTVYGSPDVFSAESAMVRLQHFNGSGYAGFRDWRIPSKKELKSLYARSLVSFRRGLDESVFSRDYKAPYWTLHDNPWLYEGRPRVVSLSTNNSSSDSDEPFGRLRWVRGPDTALLIELLHQMARENMNQRVFDKAMGHLQAALKLTTEPGRVEPGNLMVILRDLAVTCFEIRDHEAAEGWLLKVLEKKQQEYGYTHMEVFNTLVDLAALQKSTDRLPQARDTLLEAYDLLSGLDEYDQAAQLGVLYDLLVLLIWSRDFARAEALMTDYVEGLGDEGFTALPERTILMFLVLGLLRETMGQGDSAADLYRLFLRMAPPPLASAGDFKRVGG